MYDFLEFVIVSVFLKVHLELKSVFYFKSLLGNDLWVITTEDRAKHDAQFIMQNPVGGFISG